MASPTGSSKRSFEPSTRKSPNSSPMSRPPINRRASLNIPSEIIEKMEKRRASLEKLQVGKPSPWMYIYDFPEDQRTTEMLEKMQKRRASLDKLHVEKPSPWMYIYDFPEEQRPGILEKMQRKRASLDKLHIEKPSPWMYTYDFPEDEQPEGEES